MREEDWAFAASKEKAPRNGVEDCLQADSQGIYFFHLRLYLPISKRQEYLQRSGEKVLASFPVQATIHFYNDESDSEEEPEEDTQLSTLQRQEVANGSEGQAGDGAENLAEQPGGLDGRGPPPDPGSPEAFACPSRM